MESNVSGVGYRQCSHRAKTVQRPKTALSSYQIERESVIDHPRRGGHEVSEHLKGTKNHMSALKHRGCDQEQTIRLISTHSFLLPKTFDVVDFFKAHTSAMNLLLSGL